MHNGNMAAVQIFSYAFGLVVIINGPPDIGKVVRVHALEVSRERRGTAVLVPNFGTRWS
jgi:hypothetical protein